MQRHKGFTLVEMLMAMVVLAIIATIAGLNFQAYRLNMNLREAARDMVADFNLCKERAVSEGQQYQITFIPGTNSSYTIQPPAPALGTTKRPSAFGAGVEISSAAFGPGGSLVITFNTRGTVSPLGNPPPNIDGVILRNIRNSTATIQVNTMGRTYVTFTMQ